MSPLAWIGALLIGLSLGLLGSGGSILTVPALVYLAGADEKLAITQSLAIVGAISLVGLLPYAARGLVDWRRFALFGLPGVVGTALGARLSQFLSGQTQLLIFAVVMLLAATLMFRPPVQDGAAAQADDSGTMPTPLGTALQGLGVGTLTGVVGVGGGFLIVPALVLLGRLPMRYAVGTSLAIITLNSLTGFLEHLSQPHAPLDWRLIGLFAGVGILGSLLGSTVGKRVGVRPGAAAGLRQRAGPDGSLRADGQPLAGDLTGSRRPGGRCSLCWVFTCRAC
ncbi:sulfite exporter TauE/SafE family protein [Deinococcus sp. Marseille-Q6407]|uniref:sulfite exporter TauE/SafE family protein n=1 Tax=Deinococcus sp. Marseille-Q6407 TaxID=2969223 RepID=UPI0021C18E8E|nr:sulfite exporter TauE/SafE family protein [Deinococcus sp. Marseille-Q6407]